MRVLAVDYGDARTGVAVSDAAGILTGFACVVEAYTPEKTAEKVADLAREHGAEEIVVGLPLNMDGSAGPRAQKAAALAELLRAVTGLPVSLWDERRTTVDAHRILQQNGKNGRKRRKTVDAVAASLILEGCLAYKRNRNGG